MIWRTVGTTFREGDFDAITIASLIGPLERQNEYLDHKGVRVFKALPDHTFATKEQKAAQSL